MSKIQILRKDENGIMISKDFINKYLNRASGLAWKVYLFLSAVSDTESELDEDLIAEALDITSKDVRKTLDYWVEQGEIIIFSDASSYNQRITPQDNRMHNHSNYDSDDSIDSDHFADIDHMDSKTMDCEQELQAMILMAEAYLGKELSVAEISVFMHIFRDLHFSYELADYLFQYCFIQHHKNSSYMDKVALTWFEHGIDTVAKAHQLIEGYANFTRVVSKSFGITKRMLASSELAYIEKWSMMGFSTDIIKEACNRTILYTGKAAFAYADTLLKTWKDNSVHDMGDIAQLDLLHEDAKVKLSDDIASSKSSQNDNHKTRKNAFHQFDQRSYDYDQLEKMLSQKQLSLSDDSDDEIYPGLYHILKETDDE